jgi:Domain of unknown function (DUF6089)
MTISFSLPQRKVWVFMFFSLFTTTLLSAQNTELGLVLGGTAYRGDIEVRPNTAFQQMRPIAGIFYRYHTTSRLAFRGQLVFGQFHADEKRFIVPSVDNWRKLRGVSFTTSFLELSVLPELRFLSVGNVDFYAFAGVAGFYYKPNVNYNDPNPVIGDTNLDKNANFSKFGLALPIGGGLQWFINDRNALGVEMSGRKTNADYIDGLSLTASSKVKDYYFFLNLTFSTFLGSKQRGGGRGGRKVSCPTFD